jgi:hypothetical protein
MNNSSTELWKVLDYEVYMYFETRDTAKSLRGDPQDIKVATIKNALTESMVLHTRIMVEILISKDYGKDDIKLRDLLPDWCNSQDGKFLIDQLKTAYGKPNETNSPCWVFNKMLAHPTQQRADSYDYKPTLTQIESHVLNILKEIIKVKSTNTLSYYLTKQ